MLTAGGGERGKRTERRYLHMLCAAGPACLLGDIAFVVPDTKYLNFSCFSFINSSIEHAAWLNFCSCHQTKLVSRPDTVVVSVRSSWHLESKQLAIDSSCGCSAYWIYYVLGVSASIIAVSPLHMESVGNGGCF